MGSEFEEIYRRNIMIKVKIEFILNDSWNDYADRNVNEDVLLQDLMTTLLDQKVRQEEIVAVTIKSKQLI